MLGIVGDNAAGKTTLTKGVIRILGKDGVTPICLDDYYRYDRAERTARDLTALSLENSDVTVMTEHLATLRSGGTIRKPRYDHRTGTIGSSELVVATGLIVAHGVHTLATPDLRSLFDLTVYLDPHTDLLHQWRLQRDVADRGYTHAQVEANIRRSESDFEDYIRPQRRYADLVVRFLPHLVGIQSTPHARAHQCDVQIILRHGQHVARLFLEDDPAGIAPAKYLSLQWHYDIIDEDGCAADMLILDSDISTTEAAVLEEMCWRHMPDLRHLDSNHLGNLNVGNEQYHCVTLALTQLLVTYQLAQARRV